MLEDGRIPPQWLPRLSSIVPTPTGIGAHVVQYGCGSYGCVFPTLDPSVVLKVTEDDTEAEFAGNWSSRIVQPIVTAYYDVLAIPEEFTAKPTFLLWREAASHVGGIKRMVAEPAMARRLIQNQHLAAQIAFQFIHDAVEGDDDDEDIHQAVEEWVTTCETMANQDDVPELKPLGAGLVAVYRTNHVFFGDLHDGNLGLVTRSDGDRWVITDPGHVAVVAPM